ncbi:MAG: hypothetical protein VW831_04140, partial [Gammaproteobacteria bacterium]
MTIERQERILARHLTIIGILLYALMGAFPAIAYNECVDASGNASDPAEPCLTEQKNRTFTSDSVVSDAAVSRQTSGDDVPVLVELPGVGQVAVMAHDQWQVRVQAQGGGALLALENRGIMRVELTYRPRTEPVIVD